MNWNSASEFFAMGGYGLYVWGSYAVAALCFVGEFWLLTKRKRAAVQDIAIHGEEEELK
jgi:heme exporter protein D